MQKKSPSLPWFGVLGTNDLDTASGVGSGVYESSLALLRKPVQILSFQLTCTDRLLATGYGQEPRFILGTVASLGSPAPM